MVEDFYRQGKQYDAQHRHLTADVEFYRDVAKDHGGPILELACGTGRVMAPLANDGHDVTGIDIVESMLSVAQSKLTDAAQLVQSDIRYFNLEKKFRLIILAFNSIGHLYQRSDVESCFARVKKHLADDGLFVLSVFNPDLGLLMRDKGDYEEMSRYQDPDSGREVVVTEAASYDRASQIITSNWLYSIEDEKFTNQLRLRIFFPQELDALLHYAGLKIRKKFGNFDRSAFSSSSPQQIVLAEAVR